MMPSDAYDQRVENYHNTVRQAEQLSVAQHDPRYVTKPAPSLSRFLSSGLQWALAPISARPSPFLRAKLQFFAVLLGFILVTLVAYA